MNLWAFLIPGLAMLGGEFSVKPGVLVLENPEMTNSKVYKEQYTIEDMAEYHLQTIKDKADYSKSLKLYGFSMGGMVLAVLATKYRDQLPKNTQFIFLLTSSNTKNLPAISDATLAKWYKAKLGNVGDFRKILEPFFSPVFMDNYGEFAEKYFEYRADGKSGQSANSLIKQINAVRAFEGEQYFKLINPDEAIFIGGAGDRMFGPLHSLKLKELVPKATHIEIEGLGHMLNIEYMHNKNLRAPNICRELLSGTRE